MRSVSLIIIGAVVNCCYGGTKFAGPFDVQVKEPFVCDDLGTEDLQFLNSTVRKKGRNFYGISGTIILKIPFDDSLTLNGNFAVWGNGGWRPNFLQMTYKKGCSTFKTMLPGIFQHILDSNNLTSCPVPVGEYAIRDANGAPKVGIASLPYNKYKAAISFLTPEGTLRGCLGMITNVVPKQKNG